MRNFIDYLIKNTSSIIYLLLITIALTQILSRNYYQNSVFSLYFSETTNSFIDEKNKIISYLSLKQENKRLVRENMYLLKESINSNYLSLDSIQRDNFELIPAGIISNSIRFDKNFITLNVGDNDGVKIDDGIITKFGIIGIINKTSDKFSSAISLLNSEIKINAMLKKTNHFGSLFWDGLSHEKVKLTDIPKSANIAKGDTIVSGGMSYIFPKNILIGEIGRAHV